MTHVLTKRDFGIEGGAVLGLFLGVGVSFFVRFVVLGGLWRRGCFLLLLLRGRFFGLALGRVGGRRFLFLGIAFWNVVGRLVLAFFGSRFFWRVEMVWFGLILVWCWFDVEVSLLCGRLVGWFCY